MTIVDLFAGPGGWDVAAHALGLQPLGIEWDDAAVATRHAAGLRTVQADVAELDPNDYAPCTGLIASPPCQAFSMAGKGAGRAALHAYQAAIADLAAGRIVQWGRLDAACEDERAHLVLEPLRWALALRPRWIACEQVEPVLPLWEAMADGLRRAGYAAWTGVLSAERYGVPQTRRRAILLASLDGPVGEPPATHARYVAPRRSDEATLGLFDAPAPERIVLPEDRHLQPWVSMAEALGWIDGEVGFPRRADDGAATEDGYRERDLRAVTEPAGTNANDATRRADEPAPTLRFGERLNTVAWVQTNNYSAVRRDADGGRSKAGSEPFSRPVDAPSPTITSATDRWITHLNPRQAPARSRSIEEPAPTMLAEGLAHGVPVWDRGEKELQDTSAQDERAVRVSEHEAALLQSFPPGYPWQGTRTKVFQQIGNAIPPLLAWHVLQTVLAAAEPDEAAA